jgi:hypothetical protein
LHDEFVTVKYEFTTIDASIRFQGDLRRKDLLDWFDVDVIWSDSDGRKDSYGNVRGLGTIQRLKLWQDRYSTVHSITFFANHRRRWREYAVNDFDAEFRDMDNRHRRVMLNVRGSGRRGNGPDNQNRDRRFSASSIFRPRQQLTEHGNPAGSSTPTHPPPHNPPDVRYLGIQFTRNNRNQNNGRLHEVFTSASATHQCPPSK